MTATARRQGRAEDSGALKPVYCQNKRCSNGRPIGKALIGPGSIAEFCCRVCGVRRTVVGRPAPHWA
jgi:hypothetical protein